MAGNKNSGRRPDREKLELKKKLARIEPKWIKAIDEGCEARDPVCLRLYADYAYGKPIQQMDVTSADEPLSSISVHVIKAVDESGCKD